MSDITYVTLYSRTHEGKRLTIIDSTTGVSRTISDSHLAFGIVQGLVKDDAPMSQIVETIDDVPTHVMGMPANLSTHLSFNGHHLLWDGEVVNNALSAHIMRLYRANDYRYAAAVNFMERLAKNPDPVSRRNAWKWLEAQDFTLTPEGKIVGYKGVSDTEDNRSISGGEETVLVDGVAHVGHIPNPLGALVVMERSLIDPSRDSLCSRGLHVGIYDYAREFGAKVLTVLVDPQHIVAVPRDHNGHKMRVERYEVLLVSRGKIAEPIWENDAA